MGLARGGRGGAEMPQVGWPGVLKSLLKTKVDASSNECRVCKRTAESVSLSHARDWLRAHMEIILLFLRPPRPIES